MPGIVGLLTKIPHEDAEQQLLGMLQALAQEPFYRTETWIDESLGLYVGWTVRAGSFSDGMPLRNEQGDVVLVFSGEDVSEPGIRRRLKDRGHAVGTDGPGYLVHLAEEDPSFPARLNGRFHGLLVNRTAGTTTLFNDRYGMERVYYHMSKDAFYFAAEAKAILAVCPQCRRTDPRAMAELVSCGCVLENRTLFHDVHVLPCAAAWVFRDRDLDARRSYFDPREWEEQSLLNPDDYYRELREIFSRKLPWYFDAPEPMGMSLTGGLDTRMIMAWQQCRPGSLPCYTFGGTFRDCADVRVARQVARACGQPHHVITVGDEFLAHFHDYAQKTVYLTDGCADVSRSPDLFVNQMAREIAPARMTGNYGGEVLRRVRAFKPTDPASGLFHGEMASYLRQARATYDGLLGGHPLTFAVFRQAPWHHYGLLALEQTQLSLRSPFLDNDFVRTVFRAPDASLAGDDVCLRLIADGDRALRSIPTDRGPAGAAPWIAACRAGVETMRKFEYAFDYGMPQWIVPLERLLSGLHTERLFLGRHKFFHFRMWYRDRLSGYIRDILLDPRSLSRPYLEARRLEAVVNAHTTGRGNYTVEIHKLLTLEFVHRLLVDRQPAAQARPAAVQRVNAA